MKVLRDTARSFTSWSEFRETYLTGRGLVCWNISSFFTHAQWIFWTWFAHHWNAFVGVLSSVATALGPWLVKLKLFAVTV